MRTRLLVILGVMALSLLLAVPTMGPCPSTRR